MDGGVPLRYRGSPSSGGLELETKAARRRLRGPGLLDPEVRVPCDLPKKAVQVLFGRDSADPWVYEALQSAWDEGGATGRAIIKALLLEDHINQRTALTMYLKEFVLETVRIAHFSHRPSRFESVFLFNRLNDAIEFKTREQRFSLFRCEVNEGRLLALDMRLSGPMVHPLELIEKQLEELTERAPRYWNGDVTDHPAFEVLAVDATVVPVERVAQ